MSTLVNTDKLKKINLQEASKLFREGESSLYVKNVTSPNGRISMQVPDGMGGQVQLILPSTDLPLDLSNQVTIAGVFASPIFRRLVNIEKLVIIDPEAAREFYQVNKSSEKEMLTLLNSQYGGLDREGETQSSQKEQELLEADDTSDLHPVAFNVVNDEEIKESEALRMLRNNSAKFSDKDLKYIAANSKVHAIKEFAASKLVPA